ncbi:hypothetical protein [Aidingimonas lacisalsi]|uniref:hypothetical protein n=1 Tax=Aidingimonas lacisalsi TaxID=2604086 RepID=UPI0011D1B84D|nr:hypothetical protein [Aidingimonas lacisalsi]
MATRRVDRHFAQRGVVSQTLVPLLLLFMLTGCGGDGEDGESSQPAETTQPAAVDEDTATAESQSQSVETLSAPVDVSLSAERQANRRLLISGDTNLPDDTEVVIIVERSSSRLSWRSRVAVQDGRFEAGPLGPESGVPDGDYTITFRMSPPGVQPPSVQRVIGGQGEHLSGPLVSQAEYEGAVATYSTAYKAGN